MAYYWLLRLLRVRPRAGLLPGVWVLEVAAGIIIGITTITALYIAVIVTAARLVSRAAVTIWRGRSNRSR